jgi:hypothetical protein
MDVQDSSLHWKSIPILKGNGVGERMRSLVNKVKKKDQKEVKHWEWAKRWRNVYPNAVKYIEKE